VTPPGTNGTIKRRGLLGQASALFCARTGEHKLAIASKHTARTCRRWFMVFS
jgi:hypothetical protein